MHHELTRGPAVSTTLQLAQARVASDSVSGKGQSIQNTVQEMHDEEGQRRAAGAVPLTDIQDSLSPIVRAYDRLLADGALARQDLQIFADALARLTMTCAPAEADSAGPELLLPSVVDRSAVSRVLSAAEGALGEAGEDYLWLDEQRLKGAARTLGISGVSGVSLTLPDALEKLSDFRTAPVVSPPTTLTMPSLRNVADAATVAMIDRMTASLYQDKATRPPRQRYSNPWACLEPAVAASADSLVTGGSADDWTDLDDDASALSHLGLGGEGGAVDRQMEQVNFVLASMDLGRAEGENGAGDENFQEAWDALVNDSRLRDYGEGRGAGWSHATTSRIPSFVFNASLNNDSPLSAPVDEAL